MATAPSGKMGAAVDLVAGQEGAVVSRTIVEGSGGGVTLFAFAPGEGLSEHTSTKEALVHILEGRARFTLAGEAFEAAAGDLVAMPANVPHALHAQAESGCKMLLCLVQP